MQIAKSSFHKLTTSTASIWLRNYNMLLFQSGSDKYLQPERIIVEIKAA